MHYWTSTFGLLSMILLGAFAIRLPQGVVSFHKTDSEILDFWLQTLIQQENPARLTTYKYDNCGNPSKEVGNITSLIIGPDPLQFPGPLYVEFSGVAKQTVQSPITVALLLEIKVGNNYVKIPCISQIGSCTYEDVCELLSQITECPAPLVSAGIPCQCPFPQGAYNLPRTEFDVTVPVFPAGDYHAVANITSSTTSVACVELFVTFA
ncbi:hypothetical protein BsWGS_18317 [Bradybaena similaris]